MFAAKNPFEDTVTKATSDELTSEDWQLNLDICDRVSSEGDAAARNCVAAIQKRLVHRNANVQLYALTLSDTLSKNCGLPVHQELASRSFTQTLSRISLDRNTHPTVKKRCLALIKQWANDFTDDSLDLMRETYDALKQQNADFEDEVEPERPEPSSEQLRKEDEELRRVLELSVQDQGGRSNWVPHPSESQGQSSSSAAGASGSRSEAAPSTSSAAVPAATSASQAGYVPAATSSQASGSAAAAATAPAQAVDGRNAPAAAPGVGVPVASRVRALYDFSPTEPGELAFSKGDVIRVLDSVYEHWWRGEVRGEAGIFPVNYVEILPDPTPDEMRREAEMEARIFTQAANIDLLLSKLRNLDPARDNLTEDEELQELYQSSLAMRPKIVKLIDRYSTKITELKAMNDKFVRARGTFDEMMEQSLARYNPGGQSTQDYLRPRPDLVQHGSGSPMPGQQHQQQQHYSQQQQQPHGGPVDYASAGGYGQQQPQHHQPQPQQQPQQHVGYAGAPQQQGQHYPQQPLQQMHQQQQQQPQAQQAPQGQADYAQWYQQQQQQQQPHQVQGQPYGSGASPAVGSDPSAGGYGSGAAGGSSYAPVQQAAPPSQQQQQQQQQPPQDDEKRRLYERARAEGEAFQQQYFAGAAAAGGSGSAPAPQAMAGGASGSSPYHHPAHAQGGDAANGLAQGVAGLSVGTPGVPPAGY